MTNTGGCNPARADQAGNLEAAGAHRSVSFDDIAPTDLALEQCWNAMGMDSQERVYIGFTGRRSDGREDFAVFRYDPASGERRFLGSFIDASQAAGNLEPGEEIPKGHTRMPEIAVIELDTSTATVALAAAAHGVEPGRIAKTLSLRVGDRPLLVLTSGEARLDNRKAKAAFGGKVKLLGAEEVAMLTGHPVGGVCPFGLATPLPVCGPKCGSAHRGLSPAEPSASSADRR